MKIKDIKLRRKIQNLISGMLCMIVFDIATVLLAISLLEMNIILE